MIEKRNLADQVVDHIKGQILRGLLKPGERIAEERIAEDIGVSRTPIREALRKLADFGLVHIQPRSWAAVATLDDEAIGEVQTLRSLLEDSALATCTIDAPLIDDLLALQQRCEDALATGDLAAVFEADSAWHRRLAEGRPLTVDLLDRLDAKVQLARATRCCDPETVRTDLAAHRRIIRALKAGDRDAARAQLQRHITKARTF